MNLQDDLPLCVDLDGTLIHSDLLLESLLLLLKRNPFYALLLPVWLLRGKANLKAQIARRVRLNGAALPYAAAFVDWLRDQKLQGRQIWLCTASDQSMAAAVAEHVGLFDGVLASDGHGNLAGAGKAARLVERFGDKGFDYCGNHRVDLTVWRHARAAIVVHGNADLASKAAALAPVHRRFERARNLRKAVFKALRVHQWAKNALIFVPLAAAHKFADATLVLHALTAFLAFSLCASSVYLLNDMLDLEADRQHPRKSKRPFASGDLGLGFGLAAAPLLLLAAAALAFTLPIKFMWVLGAYYFATMAYSFRLKRVVMVDVLTLAGLYTVRIVAGAAATNIPLSFWLLIFSIFMFLSLALVKRYAELYVMREEGRLAAQGRGYHTEDIPLLQTLGGASGYLSVLVLALYVNSPDIVPLYHHPKLVWLLCPIMLYWISRIWMQTHRGTMHDDPLVFALKDRISLAVGALCAVVLWLAV